MTAAVHYAAGGTAADLIPSSVAALAEGASRVMNLHRLMKRAAALLLIGVAAAYAIGYVEPEHAHGHAATPAHAHD